MVCGVWLGNLKKELFGTFKSEIPYALENPSEYKDSFKKQRKKRKVKS